MATRPVDYGVPNSGHRWSYGLRQDVSGLCAGTGGLSAEPRLRYLRGSCLVERTYPQMGKTLAWVTLLILGDTAIR